MNPIDLICRRRDFRLNLEEQRKIMYRVAYSWCQDPALADDLVQEALTKAYRSLHQLREPKAMKKWMFDIMTNCWRDHLRRRRPTDDLDSVQEAELPVHADDIELNEVTTVIRKAVWALPEKYKEVLSLVDLAGFSYGETAEVLNVPIGTVTSRLSRGREMLRVSLEAYYMHFTNTNVVPLARPSLTKH